MPPEVNSVDMNGATGAMLLMWFRQQFKKELALRMLETFLWV